jgi:N-methylhydantoinase A/oxoprolinase/acetone carboxylase beta subunit
MPGAPVEWVELRVAWEIPAPAWTFQEETTARNGSPRQAPLWEYQLAEGPAQTVTPVSVNAQVFERSQLSLGARLQGPAIVLENDATTCIPTGWTAQTTRGGYLRIRKYG